MEKQEQKSKIVSVRENTVIPEMEDITIFDAKFVEVGFLKLAQGNLQSDRENTGKTQGIWK